MLAKYFHPRNFGPSHQSFLRPIVKVVSGNWTRIFMIPSTVVKIILFQVRIIGTLATKPSPSVWKTNRFAINPYSYHYFLLVRTAKNFHHLDVRRAVDMTYYYTVFDIDLIRIFCKSMILVFCTIRDNLHQGSMQVGKIPLLDLYLWAVALRVTLLFHTKFLVTPTKNLV